MLGIAPRAEGSIDIVMVDGWTRVAVKLDGEESDESDELMMSVDAGDGVSMVDEGIQ